MNDYAEYTPKGLPWQVFALVTGVRGRVCKTASVSTSFRGGVVAFLGEDHPDTLTSASNQPVDLSALGEHRAARELDEDGLGPPEGAAAT